MEHKPPVHISFVKEGFHLLQLMWVHNFVDLDPIYYSIAFVLPKGGGPIFLICLRERLFSSIITSVFIC